MTLKLLKKEFRLCMHPTALIMMGLTAMVLIPNYPYSVSFFYLTLGLYFTCLSSRENRDAAYTLTLPVSRRDMVRGRILMCCCLEMIDLALCAAFVALKETAIGGGANAAGMDANAALVGEGLLLFSLFNIIFFPVWYKDIDKVGKPFLLSSAAVFLFITAAVVSTYAVPFVRDCLDTPDPEHMTEKLLFVAGAAVCYAACSVLAVRLSASRFEKLDLH